MYGFLADAMVVLHLLYCAYVVVGQVVVVVAAPFRWEWARNPWFRYSHLLAIAVVVVEELMGWRCPLTVWEEQLRVLGGQEVHHAESFIGRLAHNILFFDLPQVFFTTVHVAMGVVVAQGVLMFPPRWFRFGEPGPPGPRVPVQAAVLATRGPGGPGSSRDHPSTKSSTASRLI